MSTNPVLKADFPDPDVIRVDDTYYMVSTTMHFMPGAVLLRSFDLASWEIIGHVYEALADTPARRLEGDATIYGQGMWAPSLRHHRGTFYVCFSANDTGRSYLFSSSRITGPWRKRVLRGFYYDCSLLFDEDNRAYIVSGNRDIYITELDDELSGPKKGGLQRQIVADSRSIMLGYEGSHIYRIKDRYYLFLIHWPRGKRRREACFAADSLRGEFRGGDILDDDLGFFNQGVAQGGIVDTPDGDWFAVLFQDRGAAGRMPVLVPLRWENGFPVLGRGGRAPERVATRSTRPGHRYAPYYASDDFRYAPGRTGAFDLNPVWEWNHAPDPALWSIDPARGVLRITSGKLSPNPTRCRNMLTQRTVFPYCRASVEVDCSMLRDGDYAGLCALQGRYGMIAVTRDRRGYWLVMKGRPGRPDRAMGKTCDRRPGVEYARVRLAGPHAVVRVVIRYRDMKDTAEFFHQTAAGWKKIGITHRLYFGLDHFTGCRFGLFLYATRLTGGSAEFSRFIYETREIPPG